MVFERKTAYLKYLSGKPLTCREALLAFCHRCRMGKAACLYSCPIGAFLKQGNAKNK